jgi:undecaprenyl diphosphate synthase
MQSESQTGLHVAIIMDGNGRWATGRGLPRVAGHRAGVAAVRKVVEHAPGLGIRTLTLYAFSSDNWTRPPQEVQSIFWIIRAFLRLECERLRQQGARLEVIGRRDRIPAPLLREIERTESATAQGRSLHLRIAIDYSGRAAIAQAVAEAFAALPRHETISADQLRNLVTHQLTSDCGNVDLLIRTGGEQRLSDFLLWESAYAELVFTHRMWPDFDESDLASALGDFNHRERRYGAIPCTSLGPLFSPENPVILSTHPRCIPTSANLNAHNNFQQMAKNRHSAFVFCGLPSNVS